MTNRVTLSPSSIRLTDSLTHSPTHRMPLPFKPSPVPMLPLGDRRQPEVSRAHAARAAVVRAAALLKRERAECSPK